MLQARQNRENSQLLPPFFLYILTKVCSVFSHKVLVCLWWALRASAIDFMISGASEPLWAATYKVVFVASQSSFTTFFLSLCSRNSCRVQSSSFWLGWPSEIPGIISPCPLHLLSTEGTDIHIIIRVMLYRCWYLSTVSLDGAQSTLNHWAISPAFFPKDYSDIHLNFVVFNQVAYIYLIKNSILYAKNNLHLEFSTVSHLSSAFLYCWECQCHF